MANKAIVSSDKLKAIANAIRTKTGKTEMLSLDEMPSEIEGIETGGGSGEDLVTQILMRTITSYSNHEITTLGSNAFNGCGNLSKLDIPNVVTMAGYGVAGTGLETISFLKLKQVGANEFQQNQKLISAYLPALVTTSTNTFANSRLLETVHIAVSRVQGFTFNNCHSLKNIVLLATTLSPLVNVNAFTNCYHFSGTVNSSYNPQGLKDGYIYVPKALVEEYKVATNWSTLASQFRAIEDYPDVTGG